MNDTELENRIKKSAEGIHIKDFSARYPDICEIAGKDAVTENAVILSKQPVTQTSSGNAGGRRGAKVAVISAICSFAVVLAALLTAVLVSLFPRESTMDMSPSEAGESSDGETVTQNDAAVNSGIYADEFYSELENAGITVADFTIYGNVTYSLYYENASPIGGNVIFTAEQTEVEVEFYTAEYSAGFDYDTEVNGVCYAIYGDLPEELLQEIAESLFLL